MIKKIEKDENGRFKMADRRGQHPHYKTAVEDYLTLWEELFSKAQETDALQFIFALLRFKGVQDAGWDSFENTIDAIRGVLKYEKKIDGVTRLNLALWLYGHIVEASDHYEIIANMVNVAGGRPYQAWNFPKIKTRQGDRERTPNEKIIIIKEKCKKFGLKDYATPFEQALDKDLRNSIYHSDYSVYEGRVRFRNARGFSQEYSEAETLDKINTAIALHETIRNLVNFYRASYDEPEIIDGGPHIANGQEVSFQVIVRKGRGVIAVHETPEHSAAMSLGIYKPGELSKIRQGIYFLPRSKTDVINDFGDKLPIPIARWFFAICRKLYREKSK